MLFKRWLLQEMPISLNLLGKWGEKDKPYGWDRPSTGILTNPVGVEKIIRKWARVEQQINAWMLRGPKVHQYYIEGEVGPEFLTQKLGLKIVPNPQKPDEINISPEAINVIFTQNRGGDQMPMTAWMIAHRLAHVFARGTRSFSLSGVNKNPYDHFTREFENGINRILTDVFGDLFQKKNAYSDADMKRERLRQLLLRNFLHSIGTMRSARQQNLSRYEEFFHELFAQHLLTGKITFNPMPDKIIQRYAWGQPQHRNRQWQPEDTPEDIKWRMENANEQLGYLAEQADQNIEYVLDSAVGKIFVM